MDLAALASKLLLLLIISLQVLTTNAYHIPYFDCTATTKIHKYAIDTACDAPTPTTEELTTYTLLQKKDSQEMEGYSCQVKASTFTI